MTATAYEARKERARARGAEESRQGRDIGGPPERENPERHAAAERNFRQFCEVYLPETFKLGWSADHLKVIAKIEAAILTGGLYALAMPRGNGKTSLTEAAAVWAILYGHRRFVVIIGSDANAAKEVLDSIKIELETNEELFADFGPELKAVHALEGITKRCKGQLSEGELTRIDWTAETLVMPTMRQSRACGAIVKVAGITGRIRGMKHKKPDGESTRPDFVIIDDPQTEESAWSPEQCRKREKVVAGAVLGLAGPGAKIAGVMPCTVIRRGDLADRMLDRDKHPEWQGERMRLVYRWPSDEDPFDLKSQAESSVLWREYAEIRKAGLIADEGTGAADAFYAEHQAAMDAGAVMAWEQRKRPEELSALQHAINLRLDHRADGDDAAFFAEYQNDPPDEAPDGAEVISADDIAAKVNGYTRGRVPTECDLLTAFIDVQMDVLFYAVAAWESATFTGCIIDYGAYPEQRSDYFSAASIRRKLMDESPGTGFEGAIYAGLERLTLMLLSNNWERDDGTAMRIDRCLIDANWGRSTETVYRFCKASTFAAMLVPSHGMGDTASSQPWEEYKRKRGDQIGDHWRMPSVQGKRSVRHVVYPTNWWKSFVQARFATAMGDPGCLSLFKGSEHRMLADHLTSEYAIETQGRGRVVQEWKLRGGFENHWLDCVVGSAVAAAMRGASLSGGSPKSDAKRKKLKLSEIQAEKRRKGKYHYG